VFIIDFSLIFVCTCTKDIVVIICQISNSKAIDNYRGQKTKGFKNILTCRTRK